MSIATALHSFRAFLFAPRRGPRFSLRWLLGFVTILACLGGVRDYYRRGFANQRAALVELARLDDRTAAGIQLSREERVAAAQLSDGDFSFLLPGHVSVGFSGRHCDRWTQLLLFEPNLKEISSIILVGGDPMAIDRILPNLCELDSATQLHVSSVAWTDRHTEAIRALKRLDSIDLSASDASDRSLEIIAGLPNLATLDVRSDRVTDRGVARLGASGRLRWLSVDSRQVFGETLANLRQLESLSLRCERLSSAGYRALGALGALKSLTIESGLITDEDAACLAALKELRSLQLCNWTLSDSALGELCGSRSIRELYLWLPRNSQVSAAGLAKLARLPLTTFELELERTAPTGPVAEQFASLRGLHALSIRAAGFDDDSLRFLGQMPWLSSLYLFPPATPAQLKTLQAQLPHTRFKRP